MRDFDWQILVTLRKLHTITKAAEQLYISQPTLTKRIQIIEDELGLPLMTRSRRGIEFTPDGERIAQMAEAVVAAVNDIKGEIACRTSGERGTLRLGASYPFVRHTLPRLLKAYSRLHPEVEIDLVVAPGDELISRTENDFIDLCFINHDANTSYLERDFVCEDGVYAAFNRPFELSELAELAYIEFVMNSEVASSVQRWWNENFSSPRKLRFKVSNSDSCVPMVELGMGYTFFTNLSYFPDGSPLYYIPLEFADGTRLKHNTWLLYQKSKLTSPVVADFVEFMAQTDVGNGNYGEKVKNSPAHTGGTNNG